MSIEWQVVGEEIWSDSRRWRCADLTMGCSDAVNVVRGTPGAIAEARWDEKEKLKAVGRRGRPRDTGPVKGEEGECGCEGSMPCRTTVITLV